MEGVNSPSTQLVGAVILWNHAAALLEMTAMTSGFPLTDSIRTPQCSDKTLRLCLPARTLDPQPWSLGTFNSTIANLFTFPICGLLGICFAGNQPQIRVIFGHGIIIHWAMQWGCTCQCPSPGFMQYYIMAGWWTDVCLVGKCRALQYSLYAITDPDHLMPRRSLGNGNRMKHFVYSGLATDSDSSYNGKKGTTKAKTILSVFIRIEFMISHPNLYEYVLNSKTSFDSKHATKRSIPCNEYQRLEINLTKRKSA